MRSIHFEFVINYTRALLERYLNKKQALYLNNFLWFAFAAFMIYSMGYRVGETIGVLVYNLSH